VSTSPIASGSYSAGFAGSGSADGNIPGTCREQLGRSNRFNAMTADGQQIFFTTSAALVPGDNNSVEDVYEWNDGNISLISAGTGTGGGLAAVDPGGRDVFFQTNDQLVTQDGDFNRDIYDTRIGGGFAVAVLASQCSGDGCQGPLTPSAQDPAAGSQSFVGPGNELPAPRARAVTLSVSRLSSAATKKFARTGKVTLTVKAGGTGTLAVRAYGALRGDIATFARFTRTITKTGTIRPTLTLSAAARKQLASSGRLQVHFEIRLTRLAKPRTLRASLQRTAASRTKAQKAARHG
jgi:hypothetical protein